MKRTLFIIAAVLFTGMVAAQGEARLLRFPAIYGDKIVFTYAGDLYQVASAGGQAKKLTSHIGYEMFARFSPDGKNIAFTAQYDGNTEVYLMPAEGGNPKRLTTTPTLSRDDISDRMGPNNIVTSWTPDGKQIVFRSRKQSWNDFVGQLFWVSPDGGMSTQLPLASGGFNSWSADGKKLAFNRVMREFRTWKYYKGGMADDVWIYDTETKAVTNITKNIAQDIFPMWWKDEIYFCSDRDRTMNLFAYDVKSGTTRKVTEFTEYDIKFPSLGDGKIVFENGGYIYVFDIATQKSQKVTITLATDNLWSRSSMKDASKNITSYDLSHDGNRMIYSARGDVWSVPVKEGITKNITASSEAHDRSGNWSPDGKWIAWLSDASGEYEIYVQASDGSGKPQRITSGSKNYIFGIEWSPDSKKILFSDKEFNLKYVDVATKAITQVTKGANWEIRQYNWSPDSRWIAYADQPLNSTMNQIFIYDCTTKKIITATENWYSSTSPVFSSDGKFLYFVSERDFNPVYSNTEWNTAYNDMSRIYFLTLKKSTPNPLAPKNDMVNVEEKEAAGGSTSVVVEIDAEGLTERIIVLPGEPGNYWNITPLADRVYFMNNSSSDETSLKMFSFKDKKETKLGPYHNYMVSGNQKKMMVTKDRSQFVIDLPSGEIRAEKPVDLSAMKVMVDPHKEWKQIYDESWRQMRDFFYDPNMHKVDWQKMYDKYSVLLPYVNNRNDLNYIIGELIGELTTGHAYVGGGDKPEPERINTGLLGAKISRHSSGYFKIDKILKGENWNGSLRSPLTEVGVDVSEGQYIVAVNGISVLGVTDLYTLLINQDGKQVELTISNAPDEKSVRKVIVVPIRDELPLYYLNWVKGNIEKVNAATNGEVGYIHIPDMSTEGLNEFVKYYYPQLRKKALIIDDRGNGGGNVSPIIMERLRREISLMGMARNAVEGNPTPDGTHLGPKIMLIDNYSASDGDMFPYQFRKHGLGKLVGVRSWGGVVGIRGSLPFIDGGYLNRPEFAHYAADGSDWIIEGHGVDPDIIIDNDPAKEFAGEDAQLNKAIELIMEDLKKNPKEMGKIPAFPDKSK